ncbi:glutamine--fructose-6-phosphate transaminase (isomerizing) [Kordiimonas sp. SCSIO 12610]|uniref:glutamine--fructose-6-phosphate transaminase (isomerizing) n=1 Tax=Kordiimonas sp. SCSIO 12610 TaxID=2829597 RepID=UPI002109C321|nr:glutamine--fructose-6-phosphate transaminase (isomerizing) [Kordiimonas sp. SCSIO 12610]UTW54881.1 glutamine--fructose-6-phosphate transaminase (isomerizing) [Kordiimonas sp. SCSIO 12610]
MCGIVGIVGITNTVPRMMEALHRLEYRGYDSAGVATLHGGELHRCRAVGKIAALDSKLVDQPIKGDIGIGHTRWATHGEAVEVNAHPHMADGLAVVHNGIIENFASLKKELIENGHNFEGETDTEVVAHLISEYLARGLAPKDAVFETLKRIEGAFALAIIIKNENERIFAARRGSPLVVGMGKGENYLGSDAIALASLSNKLIYLEEGDWAEISREAVTVFDMTGAVVTRPVTYSQVSNTFADKGNYRHFMQKEIFEQPFILAQTIGKYFDQTGGGVKLPAGDFDFANVSKVTIIACGTSYYAALVAKFWLEKMARISVEVDIASEFRYRDPVYTEGGLAIFISQSGETADTLAALKHAKAAGQSILSILNAEESSMSRESDMVFPIYAGPEIGVASTKAFTCQLIVLAALATEIARARGKLDEAGVVSAINSVGEIPKLVADVLSNHKGIEKIAHKIAKARDILFVGRGLHSAIAMEGALKLKEISYIHAEGYAAGELKHGPIALIDENVPVIGLAPHNELFDKTVSNLQEIMARQGQVIVISDHDPSAVGSNGEDLMSFKMPKCDDIASPIVYAVPVQLLAYYAAVEKGTDADQPRNLAKSVTVE